MVVNGGDRPDCNAFLVEKGREWEIPEVLYAVLDQADALGDGRGLYRLVFAAVDAGWFEWNWPVEPGPFEPGFLSDLYRRMPMFLLEVELAAHVVRAIVEDDMDLTKLSQWAPGDDDWQAVAEAIELLEGRWKRLSFAFGGAEAEIFPNLFAKAQPVSLSNVSAPPAHMSARLEQTDPLQGVVDAADSDIEGVLSGVGTLDQVLVCDVGQGNANGLLANGQIAAYFDFGGGAGGNTSTFPTVLTGFCFCKSDLPIILSHWDHDHWSSEGRDTRAHHRTWIAPRQAGTKTKRGFHHNALITSIMSHGTLLIWPSATMTLTVGQLEIWKCTGSSRNASGLAAVVQAPGNAVMSEPVLLPADAGYGDLPPTAPTVFSAIACPHHGGKSRSTKVPSCPSSVHARLMYSYGPANSYGHALHPTRSAHDVRGWTDPIVHSSPTNASKVLNTENRMSSGTGHIGFDWGVGGKSLSCGCGGSLAIDQV